MLLIAFCLFSAGLTGWIVSRTLLADAEFRYRLIAGLIVAESALLVSVHLAASVQLAGVTERFEPWHAALVLAAIPAAAAALCRRGATEWSSIPPAAREPIPAYLWVAVAVIAGTYLIGAVNAFDGYIIDYDAVSYHLLIPHHWLMDGTLAITQKTNWRFGMPGNGEAAMYWFFAAGRNRWVFLAQWPSTACLLASAYSLALALTRNRNAAWSTTALAATLPIVYYQTFNGYIDVFSVAFLLGAVALAQAVTDGSIKLSWSWCGVIGLACGIAMGSKLTYVVFVGPLIAGVAFVNGWGKRNAVGEMLRAAAPAIAGTAVTAAFWYVRGWVLAGNPMFPMRVGFRQWELFKGLHRNDINPPNWAIGRWIHSPIEWFVYPWVEWRNHPSMTSYSIDTGLGAAFATFVPLGIAFFCWFVWRRRADRQLWLWPIGLIYCGLVWFYPLHQTLRFGLIFMLLLVIASTPLLVVLGAARNRIFEGVFCAAITITCVILALEPAAFVASRRLYDIDTRAENYRYPSYVDDLPAGSTVLNLVAANNFAMTGARMSNRVVGFFEARRGLTTEFLHERGIDYIVGHDSHERRIAELAGVRLVHSEVFHDPVGLGDQPWRVWKVDPPSGDAP